MTTIAILDPTALLGKEVRTALERSSTWVSEVRLFTTIHEEESPLAEFAGEPALVQELRPGDLEEVDLILACGPAARQRESLAHRPAASTAVLLSADADLDDGFPVVAGINDDRAERGTQILSPAPAVVALAHLLAPLAEAGLARAVATVVEPVSTHGAAGLEALMEQTRELLSFNARPDAGPLGGQLAFNLLPVPAAPRAAEQLAAILGEDLPVAVTTLRGGVFHGVAISLWLQCDPDPGIARIQDALAGSVYVDVTDTPAQVGPVAVAGREEVLCGAVELDPRTPGAYWLWAAVDNLTRGGALNAVEIAETLFGSDL